MPLRPLTFVVATLLFLSVAPAGAQVSPQRVSGGATAAGQQPVSRLRIESIDLGTMDPGGSTEARAINERGVVVGRAARAGSDGLQTAFMWTEADGFIPLLDDAVAEDINNHNVVVGWRGNCNLQCPVRGFVWSAAAGTKDLGEFSPFAINDDGDMAGACRLESVNAQACVLIDGVLREIGPSPHGGIAFDINEHGVVTGAAARRVGGGGFAPYAFTWSASEGVRLLGQDDADTSSGSAINNHGTVAGEVAFNGAHSRVNATVWQEQLPSILRSSDWTMASGINDRGWVVGTISVGGTSPNRPLLWIPDGSITELPAPAGLQGYYAADINESGQIIGAAYDSRGTHAVLWKVSVETPLTFTTPNTPSRWGLNTRQRLAWTYEGDAPQFLIEVSRDSDDSWEFLDIVPNGPGPSQNFYWTVTGRPTATARLRVTAIGDEEATDINDADIRIAEPFIEVVLPYKRTVVSLGSSLRIFYKHNIAARTPVAIEVSGDGGTTWRTIADRAGTTGATTSSFWWTVDLFPTNGARVRVRALGGSGAMGQSEVFSIIAGAAGVEGG